MLKHYNGHIQIGNMLLPVDIEAEENIEVPPDAKIDIERVKMWLQGLYGPSKAEPIDLRNRRNELTEEQKREIGRMFGEGVSEAGIQAAVDACINASFPSFTFPPYAPFVEYGKPPTKDPANVVDGSLVEPIADPARLLEEAE